jgi:MFS family permease
MVKLMTLLLSSSMTVMAGATISPALPRIQEHFGIAAGSPGELWVKLLLTMPALFTAIGGAPSGVLIDRYGGRVPLMIAVALYGVAGSSGLWLDSIPALLVGRALLGLSVAMITTASVALIADYYQGSKRVQVLSWQAAFMGLGGVVFLLLGGFLADIDWRLPFLIYLVAFAVLPLVWRLPEKVVSARTPEETAAIATETIPWVTIGIVYGLTFITMVIFYMIPVQVPFYVRSLGFGGGQEAGIAIATTTLASAFASVAYAKLKANLSFSKVLMCLYFLMASGYGVMANAGSYGILLLGLAIAGLGLGLVLPNMNVWLNAKTPPEVRGKVLGGLTTCLFLGQFCSPLVLQPLAGVIPLAGTYSLAAGVLFLMALLIAAVLLTRPYKATSGLVR